MDSDIIAEFFREASKYRIERPVDWQGPLARGGLSLASSNATSTESDTRKRPSIETPTSHSRQIRKPESMWPIIEEAVGGGEQAKLVSKLMQKRLMARIDGMPLDEIELMAGGESTST